MPVVKFKPNMPIEIISCGRAGIDLNTQKLNCPLKDNDVYVKTVGGSPANIVQGLAHLGVKAGFIGKVAGNGMGDYIKEVFTNKGIDTKGLIFDQTGAPNCLAITEILSPSNSGSYFYRNGTADLLLDEHDISEDYIKNSAAVIISGTALSQNPSRDAMYKIAEYANKHGTLLIMDIDFRPYGWVSKEETSVHYNAVLSQCDIILGNREEFDAVEYTTMPNNRDNIKSAKVFLDKKAQLVIIKDGERGSLAVTRDGSITPCSIIDVPIKKTFGSGDAYAAGLLCGLLKGYELLPAMQLGSACAAITLTGMSCAEAMPTLEQAEQFLAQSKFKEMD